MKTNTLICGALVSALAIPAWSDPVVKPANDPAKMKMTTEIPAGVATPDTLETALGTLTSPRRPRSDRSPLVH